MKIESWKPVIDDLFTLHYTGNFAINCFKMEAELIWASSKSSERFSSSASSHFQKKIWQSFSFKIEFRNNWAIIRWTSSLPVDEAARIAHAGQAYNSRVVVSSRPLVWKAILAFQAEGFWRVLTLLKKNEFIDIGNASRLALVFFFSLVSKNYASNWRETWSA